MSMRQSQTVRSEEEESDPARPEVGSEGCRLPPGPSLPRALQTLLAWRFPQPFLHHCHSKYGDIFTVRAAPVGSVVLIADPAGVKQVFTGKDEIFRGGNDVMRLTLGSSSLAVVHGEEHLSTRRIMLPHFQGDSVRRYESLVRELARAMVDGWPLHQEFSIFPHTQKLTLEVILRAVIGANREEDLDALRIAMPRFVDIGFVTELIWMAPWLGRFGPWKRYLKAMRDADRLLYRTIEKRCDDPELDAKEDVLSLLIKDLDEEPGDQQKDWLRDQMVTLILAGHDTTASGLAWAIDLLLRNPDVLRRARGAAEQGDVAYMNALVREVLRVRPVVFQVARKLTEPVDIGGYRLPADVLIAPAIGLVHQSPSNYADPDAFRPERFLEEEGAPYHWIPFGGGVRRCPGAAFAAMEMRIALEEVLRRTTLSPASRSPERPRPRHINSMPARGGRVILTRRDRARSSPVVPG